MGAGAIQERSGRVPRAMVRGVLIALLVAPLQVALADTPLVAVPVASGLGTPIFATHAPGDTQRLFSVDLPGRIRIIDLSQEPAVVVATPFLDIATRVLYGGEQGLLGLAFHPAFASNGFFYVYYTSLAGHNVLSRFSVPSATPNAADPNSEVVLLDLAPPQANHRGGWIAFGPQDGYLYVAIGDGGGAGDTGTGHTAGTGNAQDLTNNLFGKILRIDVDGTNGPTGTYGIPPSNPHVGLPGDDEIWAHGLRNPWRESFDPLTGDLYIADVGQAVYEEVDLQPGASAGGENWGWRCREGAHDYNTLNCGGLVLLDPIHEYTHGGDPSRCAIIGGEIYRGTAIPDLAGTYFYADLCSSQIWSFRVVNGRL